MKRNKLFLSVICACLLFCSLFALILPSNWLLCCAEGNLSPTSAKAMCVMEMSSGRVLDEKNGDTLLPMASTTKIMTALTAIENCANLDEMFEISPKAVGISGTSIYLREGENLSVHQLLYGLMLVSGNDASVAIAERVGGSTNKFVDMMNRTARKIGAFNTHFDNPHGLDSKTHYTTAKDLALITSYALKNPTFKEIVTTKHTKITSLEGKTRYLRNKNKLLFSLDGCIGVKTGFTDDAGRCLVSACENDTMGVVCVVLNCGPMFEESRTILETALEKYQLYDLTQDYTLPNTISVENGRVGSVRIGTKGKYFYPLTTEEKENVRYVYNISKSIEAPADKDTEIGDVQIFINNNLHFSEKIYTIENVRRSSIWQNVKQFVDRW